MAGRVGSSSQTPVTGRASSPQATKAHLDGIVQHTKNRSPKETPYAKAEVASHRSSQRPTSPVEMALPFKGKNGNQKGAKTFTQTHLHGPHASLVC